MNVNEVTITDVDISTTEEF